MGAKRDDALTSMLLLLLHAQLFHTRYSLFKQIYLHKATKAIEYMITDALAEAGIAPCCLGPLTRTVVGLTLLSCCCCRSDAGWNRRISNAIDDPREYVKLTDFVLKVVTA